MRLNIAAFAVTTAVIWGFGLFVMIWWVIAFEGNRPDAAVIGSVYVSYGLAPWGVTPLGSLAALGWGLLHGLIGGTLFAALYNWLAGRLAKGGLRGWRSGPWQLRAKGRT